MTHCDGLDGEHFGVESIAELTTLTRQTVIDAQQRARQSAAAAATATGAGVMMVVMVWVVGVVMVVVWPSATVTENIHQYSKIVSLL